MALKLEEEKLALYVPTFIPITSSCQVFLLNKIEIGQFLYMKYETGKPRAIAIIEEIVNSLKFLDMHAAVKNILTKNTIPNLLGSLFVKSSSWLFKNILLSVYFIWLNLASMYGTKVSDKTKETKLPIPEKSAICSLKKTLKHIPNQNIKFQKLSLFSRALIQFIIGLKVRIHNLTITWFTILSKEIIKFLVITIVSFSQNIVFGQDLSELISTVEKEHNIPSGLLKAIAEVESGLKAYAINIAGKSFITKSKLDASKIIRVYLRKGYTNIDVGVMQINMHWHRKYFASFEEMLTPKNNVEYAAKLLTDLYSRHGDWQKAVRLYHSAKPYHHKQYSRKVLLSWLGD
ncbi:lytic transglycosylase domain-containing protein [Candidatus Tisiphia endosymbiont of Nemotelus uliginosus]|uniref:lytic transglycosylase domain-containing protein n=1 Tax=Candidatus Tisiphia endosymbiont of Nemotelus uliginosus TaxID=3077926 RepID=UPI0035C88BA8